MQQVNSQIRNKTGGVQDTPKHPRFDSWDEVYTFVEQQGLEEYFVSAINRQIATDMRNALRANYAKGFPVKCSAYVRNNQAV